MDLITLPGIGAATATALVFLSFLTSAITASLGGGGGLLMLAAMATVMPAAAVIPVHGLVQLGSNGGRALLSHRHVMRRITATLLTGAAVGAVAGSVVLLSLPVQLLQLSIALFIVLVVWLPLPAFGGASPSALSTGAFGVLTGFLSLFVGATGPIVGAYIHRIAADRFAIVATVAACMTGLNVLKLAAFSVVGFGWLEWLALALLMIASGALGTWCGLRMLGRFSERGFRRAFRLLLTALALHLAWQGLAAMSS